MIEQISDVLFILSIIILLIFGYNGLNFSLLYRDNKWGLITDSIVLIYTISAILTFITIIYVPYLLGINTSVSSYQKLNVSLSLVISSSIAYFLSSKVMKIATNFFIKQKLIFLKK
ncbi:MAG: hypothetical protein PWQ63_1571 [Methanolobus sp.]|nr:hypothetical protein [Methanolobus sp.]MDK2948411.1 hypothetical protein [Methanolobus sp.]